MPVHHLVSFAIDIGLHILAAHAIEHAWQWLRDR